ncbi:MAG: efflux RND transporter periplasmic adaptor subunit [Verrucomicrobiota bacterium]
MLRKLIKIGIALIIISVGLTSLIVIQELRRSEEKVSIEKIQQREGMPVEVTRPETRSFTEYMETDGEVTGEHRNVLRSRISETVEEITVKVGERVQAGDPLIKFRQDDLEAAVEARETAVREAKNNYKRYLSLNEKEHVTLQELEQRKTALENAREALRKAKSDFEFTVIKSPVDGIVEQRDIETGEFVNAGTPLLTILDPSDVAVRSKVPSDFINRIEIGMSGDFKTEGTDTWQQAEVTRIRPATDNPNRFFDVYMDLETTDDKVHTFRPGMYSEVRFPENTFTEIPAVPKECLRQVQGQYFLYGIFPTEEKVPLSTKAQSNQKPDGFFATVRWALRNYFNRWNESQPAAEDHSEEIETKTQEMLVAKRINVTPGIQDDGCIQIRESDKELPEQVVMNPHEDLQDNQKVDIVNKQGDD